MLLLASCAFAAGAAEPAGRTEVVVLSTLHQLHGETRGYGYRALGCVIEALEPDVLAVELTPDALRKRADQRVKREYPEVVYPLLERRRYPAIALEPAEPEYSRLVAMFRNAEHEFATGSPQRDAAFDAYGEQLFAYLADHWDSPASVNSTTTDALFEVKHRYQDAVMPSAQAAAWKAWNAHFLDRIAAAAPAYRGRRMVVLAGAEHGYLLRDALRGRDDIVLVETAQWPAQAAACR